MKIQPPIADQNNNSLILHDVNIIKRPHFNTPVGNIAMLTRKSLRDFDAYRFNLTDFEVEYCISNKIERFEPHHASAQWISKKDKNALSGLYVERAVILTRLDFVGGALFELQKMMPVLPAVHKLMNLKYKWGIAICLEWIDIDGLIDLIYIERDFYDLDILLETKEQIEKFVINVDWERIATILKTHKHEWINLDAEGQAAYRAKILGLTDATTIWKLR